MNKKLVLGGAAVVVVLAAIAGGSGGGGSSTTTVDATSAPSEQSTPVAIAPDEPSEAAPEELPTPAPEVAFEDISLKAGGAKVAKFTLPPETAAIAKVTYRGGGNFAIWTVGPDGDEIDLLVNEIGAYSGTVLFNEDGGEVVALKVEADAAWSALIRPVIRAPAWNQSKALTGKGDAVYRLTPPSSGLTTVRLVNKGDGNFAIWAYGDSGVDLLVNEIDSYSGETLLAPGTFVLEISGASWSITPE